MDYRRRIWKYILLTKEFYQLYKDCTEIEKKEDRPYTMLVVKLDEVQWAIPLRSNIHHKHVVWSDKENNYGLDLSKSVVIEQLGYISNSRAYIRDNEFKNLKAYSRRDIARNEILCKYSTLQYFHKYIAQLKETDLGEIAID